MECALCQDIYRKGGSVEGFLAHYNKDHYGQLLPTNCKFHVFQCELCNLVTKTRRGLSRHQNAKHLKSSSLSVESHASRSGPGCEPNRIGSSKGTCDSVPSRRDALHRAPQKPSTKRFRPQDLMSHGGTWTIHLDSDSTPRHCSDQQSGFDNHSRSGSTTSESKSSSDAQIVYLDARPPPTSRTSHHRFPRLKVR